MAAATFNITDIQLFNTLKQKLGEREAEDLVGYIKTSVRSELDSQVPNIATKDFVSSSVSEAKSEIIKWMFVFVFTSTLATIGSILAIVKAFYK